MISKSSQGNAQTLSCLLRQRALSICVTGCLMNTIQSNLTTRVLCYMGYYCQQTKFVKVLFSQVSVCPRGGVSAPLYARIHTPQADPPGQTPPPGRHPSVQCIVGFGQQAGGTHPTGMHSC